MRNFTRLQALRDKLVFEGQLGKTAHDQRDWGTIDPDEGYAVEGRTTHFNQEFILVSCPTSACAAGHVVIDNGEKMLFSNESVVNGEATAVWCQAKDGKIRRISDRAEKLLGLTEAQAGYLFDGDSSREEVVEMLDILLKDDMPTKAVTAHLKALYREHDKKRYPSYYAVSD